MSRNLYFDMVLDKMAEIHDKKNEDYADDDNPFSNFEGAAAGSGLSVDQVFLVMLNIKSERLRQITGGKAANFESLEDSILDMANYAAIWLAWRWSQEEEQLRASREKYRRENPESAAMWDEIGKQYAEAWHDNIVNARPLWGENVTFTVGDVGLTPDLADIIEQHEATKAESHIYPEEEIPHGTVEPPPNKPAKVKQWQPGKEGGVKLRPPDGPGPVRAEGEE